MGIVSILLLILTVNFFLQKIHVARTAHLEPQTRAIDNATGVFFPTLYALLDLAQACHFGICLHVPI